MVPLRSHFCFMLTRRQFILLAFCVLLFAPYIFSCFFAMPFADDFCFAWTASQHGPFLQKFLNQYLLWNGRYTADVLVNIHPLLSGKVWVYQLTLLFGLLATPVVFLLFFKRILKQWNFALLFAAFSSLYYFNQMPSITEGVYWYIGISNYLFGNLLFLLHLYFAYRNGKVPKVAALILLFLATGFNEVGAVLIPSFSILAFFYIRPYHSQYKKEAFAYIVVSVIAAALVFLSPGNFVRGAEFQQSFQIGHSVLYAGLQTARFIANWMLNVPFICLSLLLYLNARHFEETILGKLSFSLTFLFMLFVVFVSAFLPYMATGILGQHRTINFSFFFFIPLWVILVIKFANSFPLQNSWPLIRKPFSLFLFTVAALLGLAFMGNGFSLTQDLQNGAMARYKAEFYQRQLNILARTDKQIPALFNRPQSFTVTDARADSTWWVDKCIKNYYGLSGKPLR